MSKLPKLKVKFLGLREEMRDFEQGKYLLFSDSVLILVEGQVVRSYEELVQLAAQDRYKDKESLEVLITTAAAGG
jgi:hypothetical protein